MKILVYSHRLELGGVQVNVADLSAALRDMHGHHVAVFATPGRMLELIHKKNLPFFEAPDATAHPSWARMKALTRVLEQERPDVLHVWDWPQILDSYYVAHVIRRLPMVATNMSMTLDRLLPKFLPLTFGTPELVDQAKRAGRTRVDLLVPPVDVHRDAPEQVDSEEFMNEFGLSANDINIVTVSRLVNWLKAESLRETMEVVRQLGKKYPLRFILVGDGTSRGELQALADRINSELNRKAVILTGPILDPRPAYAAATIVVGMGGSALRAMAFGKPVIIAGEQGFAAPFTQETASKFLYQGMYGLGRGKNNETTLLAAISTFLERADDLSRIGSFSRDFVVRHFSLETVSALLDGYLRAAVEYPQPRYLAALDGLRTAAIHLGGTFVTRPLRALRKA